MSNELVEIEHTNNLCKALAQTPHYKKLGPDGIFAIVSMSQALGVDVKQALNGGLYFVKGKVEMTSALMNSLIRSAKHSITKDKRSDDTICILHGRRADNGDTWTESFSLEDAKKAGIANNMVWKTYTRDMLFARALSRLARQLFPDVIKGCYVQGEIDPSFDMHKVDEVEIISPTLSPTQLLDVLEKVPDYKAEVEGFLSRKGITFDQLDSESTLKIYNRANQRLTQQSEVTHG